MNRADLALVAAGTALIGVCYGFARFAYGLFAPAMADDLALTPGLSGLIASGAYVGYCVAIVLAMLATARWGARPVAVAAGLVATVGCALVASAPTAGVLAVGVLVAGSSTGVASPPLAQAVATHLHGRAGDRAQTLVNAGTGTGVLVSGLVGLAVADQWRLGWTVLALGAAVVTVAVWRSVPAAPDRPDGARPERLRLDGPATRMLTAAALVGLGSVAVWTSGRDLVEARSGLSVSASAVLWVVIGVAGVTGAFGGDLVRRIGLTRAWTLACLVMSGATALLALGSAVAWSAYVAGLGFGAAYIMLTGLVLLWAARLWPDQTATGVGAGFLALALGQAVGSVLVGPLTGLLGPAGVFLACAGAGVAAAALRPVGDPATPTRQWSEVSRAADLPARRRTRPGSRGGAAARR